MIDQHEPIASHVQVLLPMRELDAIFCECDQHDHEETGGRLIGRYRTNSDGLTIELTGVIPAGPAARRTSVSLFQDGDYQARIFRKVESTCPEIEHLGSWHTHHVNGYPSLSEGDRATYIRTVNHPQHNTDFFYALLVVRRDPHGTALDRYHVRHYIVFRNNDTFYEIPHHKVRTTDASTVPHTKGTPKARLKPEPSEAPSIRYRDQILFTALYPEMKPFMSRGGRTIVWKGTLRLIDRTNLAVVISETDLGDYLLDIPSSPVSCKSELRRLTRLRYESAASAAREAETLVNYRLYTERSE